MYIDIDNVPFRPFGCFPTVFPTLLLRISCKKWMDSGHRAWWATVPWLGLVDDGWKLGKPHGFSRVKCLKTRDTLGGRHGASKKKKTLDGLVHWFISWTKPRGWWLAFLSWRLSETDPLTRWPGAGRPPVTNSCQVAVLWKQLIKVLKVKTSGDIPLSSSLRCSTKEFWVWWTESQTSKHCVTYSHLIRIMCYLLCFQHGSNSPRKICWSVGTQHTKYGWKSTKHGTPGSYDHFSLTGAAFLWWQRFCHDFRYSMSGSISVCPEW